MTPYFRRAILPRAILRRAAAVALIVLGAISPTAFAQDEPTTPKPPLTGTVELRARRCRSSAPIPILWKLNWNSQAVTEGTFEYEIYDWAPVARFRLPGFVLSPGANGLFALLPAVSAGGRSSATLRARFVTGNQTFEIDEQSLRVPAPDTPWFAVGVVAGGTKSSAELDPRFIDEIRLETFAKSADSRDQSATVASDFRVDELSADPLTLCCFDVVVLAPSALAEIRDDQAAALIRWISAGGSVCIVAGGNLSPKHAVLLNQLFSESPDHAAFAVDPRGNLLFGKAATGVILSTRRGLGRVVLVDQSRLATLRPDGPEWRTAAGFLLRLRRDQMDALARGEAVGAANPPMGLVNPQIPPGNGNAGAGAPGGAGRTTRAIMPRPTNAPSGVMLSARAGYSYAELRSGLSAMPLRSADALFNLLMPAEVHLVPLWLIGGILAVYVVVIGPVDYFVLGIFRVRRYTWVLFPIVTMAFTAFTVWLSHRYLGTNDSRRSVEICDVVPGGVTVRKTRLEMLFLSTTRDVGTDVRNGMFSHVGVGMSYAPMGSTGPTRSLLSAPLFVQRFPSRYTNLQTVPQWTPVVNRYFWIAPKSETIDGQSTGGSGNFDWGILPDVTTFGGQRELSEKIRRAFGNDTRAVVYQGGREIEIVGSLATLRRWNPAAGGFGLEVDARTFFRELSVRLPERLFSFVSHVSPNGGPELDDLAMLDPSDPRQSLLLVAVEQDSQIVVYRRLYFGAP